VAVGCRYSVRDIGFVDLGAEPYRFYGYVSPDTPPEIAGAFAEMSHAAFLDSNVSTEIIDPAKEKDHPAAKYLDVQEIGSFPAGVLVSPDGQSLVVPITKPNQPFEKTLRSALENVVSSPKRDEILRAITTAYAVILLIEGEDREGNSRAQKAARDAIQGITKEMEVAPESVVGPPLLVVAGRESFSREKMFLWSLGLDVDKVDAPRAAVLYGRMRWIGPLMKGEEISEANLSDILSVIGAQCECGFDISWTEGTMLPTRWDGEMRARAAKALGFDPENPMVKMEVSGILRRGSSYSGAPFGYVELTAESEPHSETQNVSLAGHQNKAFSDSPADRPVSGSRPLAESKLTIERSLYLAAGLAVLVLIVGSLMFFRAAIRNHRQLGPCSEEDSSLKGE
jgi:hypothetical protein